jgi:hypothetical protein
MGEQAPPELREKVAHTHLKSGMIEVSATDWQHPTRKPVQGNTVAMYVDGGAYAELKEIFDRLSEGADMNLLDELRELPLGTYVTSRISSACTSSSVARGRRRRRRSGRWELVWRSELENPRPSEKGDRRHPEPSPPPP